MNTLEEVLNKGDKFAKITAYNLSTNILDRFTEEHNGTVKELKDTIVHWCEYKGNLITFTYPIGYHNMDMKAFGNHNPLMFQVNTIRGSLRLIDIATSFGKYITDLDEQYEKFLEVIDIKIQVAGFSHAD